MRFLTSVLATLLVTLAPAARVFAAPPPKKPAAVKSTKDAAIRKAFELLTVLEHDKLKAHLAKHAIDVESRDANGRTLLHVALLVAVDSHAYFHKRMLDEVELLLSLGADVDATTPGGRTVLLEAIATGDPYLPPVLVPRTKDVQARDAAGNSLLHHAVAAAAPDYPGAYSQPSEAVRAVLKATGQTLVSARNANQQTPLLHLVAQTQVEGYALAERLRDLMRAGADPGEKDVFGKSAADYLRDGDESRRKTFNDILIQAADGALDKPFYSRPENKFNTRFEEQLREQLAKYNARRVQESSAPARCATCPRCHGFGNVGEKTWAEPCEYCGGRGTSGYERSTLDGYRRSFTYLTPRTCGHCNGTGRGAKWSERVPCPDCGGTGCEGGR